MNDPVSWSCANCADKFRTNDGRIYCMKINMHVGEEDICDYLDTSEYERLVLKHAEIIMEQDKSKSENEEGCYIATAVYGGYDMPQVLVLRQFRDNVLKQTVCGRLFIRAYYRLSPQVAKKA